MLSKRLVEQNCLEVPVLVVHPTFASPYRTKSTNKLTSETAVSVLSQPENAEYIYQAWSSAATKVVGGETVMLMIKSGSAPLETSLVPEFPYIYHPAVLPTRSVVNADQSTSFFFG